MGFRVYIDEERCKGCELCVDACPQAVLEMSGRLNAKGYDVAAVADQERCTGCGLCATMCPDVAVAITKQGDGGAKAPAPAKPCAA